MIVNTCWASASICNVQARYLISVEIQLTNLENYSVPAAIAKCFMD